MRSLGSSSLLLLAPLLLSTAAAQSKPGAARGAPPAAPAASTTAPPFSLTASDGSGLTLVALEGRSVVEGPLAYTELHLTFENPEQRVREGTFQITLPTTASVSRFAMKVGDQWQEGEVVERQRARQIYEDFLHRRQDPALLEQQAANVFSARVFPIPAGARKELILSYHQELARADEPYRLPLLGLPEVASLDLTVLVSKTQVGKPASNLGGERSQHEVVTVKRTAWRPDQDLVVQPTPGAPAGLREGDLVVARVSPEFKQAPDPVKGLAILLDRSASRMLAADEEVALVTDLAGLLRASDPKAPLAVYAFDQSVTAIYEGTAGGFGEGDAARLRELLPLGASDLNGALLWMGERLKGGSRSLSRALIVTDGVATAGETEGDVLRASAAALGAVGVKRVDAIAVGGIRDGATLSGLVGAGLERPGIVIDGDLGAQAAMGRLSSAVRSGIEVKVPGAEWVWPETLDGVQPGDEVLVYAGLAAGKPFSLLLEGGRQPISDKDLAGAPLPLLERAAAAARIDRLTTLRDTRFAGDQDLREAMKSQALALSLEHRVLSPWTALLVLESQADYDRYGLNREALADILTVGPAGLEVLNRTSPVFATQVATAPSAPAASKSSAAPVGGRRRDANASEPPPPPGAPPEPAPVVSMDRVEADGDGTADDALAVMEREEAPPRQRSRGADEEDVRDLRAAPSPRPSAEAVEVAAPARSEAASGAAPSDDVAVGRASSTRAPWAEPSRRPPPPPPPPPPPAEPEAKAKADPWTGPYKEVMDLLRQGRKAEALKRALAWHAESPDDTLALIALGAAWQANGDLKSAARAYGSLIDLYPSRADLRRTAGNWLDALGTPDARALAVDTYRNAVAQRPDHPSSHRMYAYALLSAGRPAEAFAAIEAGVVARYPSDRFRGATRILTEDAGIIGAALVKADPARRAEVIEHLSRMGGRLDESPSLRFVLSWETDANDVDFHITDGRGNHAYYKEKTLASGGQLYEDVTTGYGPECFAIPGTARAWPYTLEAHYYSRGPMGFGMGTLVALDYDGKGGVRTQSQPFVVMNDQAFIDLGVIKGGLR